MSACLCTCFKEVGASHLHLHRCLRVQTWGCNGWGKVRGLRKGLLVRVGVKGKLSALSGINYSHIQAVSVIILDSAARSNVPNHRRVDTAVGWWDGVSLDGSDDLHRTAELIRGTVRIYIEKWLGTYKAVQNVITEVQMATLSFYETVFSGQEGHLNWSKSKISRTVSIAGKTV